MLTSSSGACRLLIAKRRTSLPTGKNLHVYLMTRIGGGDVENSIGNTKRSDHHLGLSIDKRWVSSRAKRADFNKRNQVRPKEPSSTYDQRSSALRQRPGQQKSAFPSTSRSGDTQRQRSGGRSKMALPPISHAGESRKYPDSLIEEARNFKDHRSRSSTIPREKRGPSPSDGSFSSRSTSHAGVSRGYPGAFSEETESSRDRRSRSSTFPRNKRGQSPSDDSFSSSRTPGDSRRERENAGRPRKASSNYKQRAPTNRGPRSQPKDVQFIEDMATEPQKAKQPPNQLSKVKPAQSSIEVFENEVVNVNDFPPYKLDALVTCHPGLEEILSFELSALGLSHELHGHGARLTRSSARTSVLTIEDLMRCHLHLGTASQILLKCGPVFSARTWGELQRKIKRVPWRELLLDDGNVELKAKTVSEKSRLFHTNAISQRVVESIQETLATERTSSGSAGVASTGQSTNADCLRAPVQLLVNISRDQVEISLDTSLTPLHRRNYRLETAKAPLREDLAYALVYHSFREAGIWKKNNPETQQTVFIDPFCGSGTLPIEAATMARRLAPGRLRDAPFSGTKLYDAAKWSDLVKQSSMRKTSKAALDSKSFRIIASDRDAGAVEIAKSNARRAGLDDSAIEFHNCAISDLPKLCLKREPSSSKDGETEEDDNSTSAARVIVVTNPPFGRRVVSSKAKAASASRHHQLLPLYQTFASRVSDLEKEANNNFTLMILTDDSHLVRRTFFGHKFIEKLKINHGSIPVTGMMASKKSSK